MINLYSEGMKAQSVPARPLGFPRMWWTTAIGGALALVAIAVLPVDSLERSLVARGTGLLAVLLFVMTYLTLPRPVRAVWLCMGGFLALTAVADIMYDYQLLILEIPPFPGISDVLYLATYGFAITGLFLLARKLNPGADLSSWIDISIMVIAAAGIVGAFVIGPVWSANDNWDLATVLSLLYPLLDLVLLAALVRLLMLPHARNAAISLLATSMGLFLAYDLIYNNQLLAEVWTPVSSMEVVWTAAMLCIPLAAMSPGAQRFVAVDPSQSAVVTTTRQLLIGISAMAVPSIVLLELAITGSSVLRWLVPVILLLLALVLMRVHLLLRIAQRQSTALAELDRGDSLTGLPNRAAWNQQLQSRAALAPTQGGVLTITILSIDNLAQHRGAKSQQIGDLLLVSATLAWLGELATEDVIARYGDDAFALLIQRDSMSEVQEVLRRVLRATPEDLSVSSGAALLRPNEDPVEAEQRATSALLAMSSGARDVSGINHTFAT